MSTLFWDTVIQRVWSKLFDKGHNSDFDLLTLSERAAEHVRVKVISSVCPVTWPCVPLRGTFEIVAT